MVDYAVKIAPSLLCILLLVQSHASAQRLVRVGVFPNYPALFIQDGKPAGFFKDLTDEIARRNDWRVEYVIGTLAESNERIRTAKIDLLPCTSPSPARREFMDFGSQSAYTGWGQVYCAPGIRLESVLDIAGRRLAYVEENNSALYFRNLLSQFDVSYTPVPCREPPDVLKAIESGSADAGVINNIFGNAVKDRYNIRETGILFHPFKLYYVTPKGTNADLLAAIDRYLEEAKQDKHSGYFRLIRTWFEGGTHRLRIGRKFALVLAGLFLLTITATVIALLFRARVRTAVRDLAFANEKLRAGEENLRTTLQSIGDGVIATDIHGIITRINPAAERLTGWHCATAIGHSLSEVFVTRGTDTTGAIGDKLSTDTCGTPDRQHVILRDKVRVEKTVQSRCTPILDSSGKQSGTVLVFRDVTEEIATQERLRQSQKMDVVGQLAGGIAHDFNNMLSGIMGFGELLLLDLPTGSDAQNNAAMILEAARKASDLTKKLLLFSRKGSLEWRTIDIHDAINAAMDLLGRSIDRRIRISTEFRADPSSVAGDGTLLENVFLNLALNARDAMPQGGALTFRSATRTIEPGMRRPDYDGLAPGSYIEISVSDTGMGMEPEVLSKLFDPFFTTKPVGKGTGLGLTAVYGTIKEHQGSIKVQSVPGAGTTFTILLPVSRESRAAETPEKPVPHAGRGCILIVDDEPVVRHATQAQLRSLGYEVMTASDGEQAESIFRTYRQRISLVMLDIVMPGIGGVETFKRLRKIRPDVKIVICSGYTGDESVSELLAQGACDFLPKPFQLSVLSARIGSVIANAG